MTKYFSIAIVPILVSVIALGLFFYVFTASAYAEVRNIGERDRTVSGRVSEPAPQPTSPTVTAPKTPSSAGGGISNSTGGTADSGGNQSGNVITGDEHVEIIVVNIGPTNNPPTVVVTPPDGDSPPVKECDSRTRIGCTTPDQARTR